MNFQAELHNIWLFFTMLYKVGLYTGLILVPVVLLVCELLRQFGRYSSTRK